jgi:hypothetical protein
MMVQVVALAAMLGSMSAVAAEVAEQAAVEQTAVNEWNSDYGQALAAARADQAPLLVVLENRTSPATSLDESLFADDAEQTKALKPYRLCRVDVSTEYGQKVATAFGATQFPLTAIIDKSGSVILHKQAGQLSADQWKSTLAKHQSGERATRIAHSSFYRGATPTSGATVESYPTYSTPNYSTPSISSPSYCPSCQRRPMAY